MRFIIEPHALCLTSHLQILVQNVSEHHLVLMSADLGEPPPDGGEKLYRTMLEANNLFAGTAGATLARTP